MEDTIRYTYVFRFADGRSKRFDIVLDKTDLLLRNTRPANLPAWARLASDKCEICPQDEWTHEYCPIAANLAGIVEEFKDVLSHEKVNVTVVCEERIYEKATTVQGGLSPLLGIIMTTSGCPILEQLKPMVRFHLPFASLDETLFRGISMYLLSQYFRHREGRPATWSLKGLLEIYAEVGIVNRDFSRRIRTTVSRDASLNALVNLDVFASIVQFGAEDALKRLKPYYQALIER